MLQVESKLELFEDVVYKRRLLDLEKRREAWEDEKENLIARKNKQLSEEQQHIVERRENLARVMGNEEIAKARENERVLELKKINELGDDFVDAIRSRVKEYTATEAYKDNVLHRVMETLDTLEPGEYHIGMVKEDLDAFQDAVLTSAKEKGFTLHPYVLPEECIGGHTLMDMKKTYSLNYDLATKITEKRYEIGKLLYGLFRREMEHA